MLPGLILLLIFIKKTLVLIPRYESMYSTESDFDTEPSWWQRMDEIFKLMQIDDTPWHDRPSLLLLKGLVPTIKFMSNCRSRPIRSTHSVQEPLEMKDSLEGLESDAARVIGR